jgi:hypothetical protein
MEFYIANVFVPLLLSRPTCFGLLRSHFHGYIHLEFCGRHHNVFYEDSRESFSKRTEEGYSCIYVISVLYHNGEIIQYNELRPASKKQQRI